LPRIGGELRHLELRDYLAALDRITDLDPERLDDTGRRSGE
jgi:hypothetical protein